jgi:hypothetical protein
VGILLAGYVIVANRRREPEASPEATKAKKRETPAPKK